MDPATRPGNDEGPRFSRVKGREKFTLLAAHERVGRGILYDMNNTTTTNIGGTVHIERG
jgi:hypothetical protein